MSINYSKRKCINLILILTVLFFEFIKSDQYNCGIPGTSLKSSIKTALSNEKVVKNGIIVKYSCDYNDAPFIIGETERECVDGEWTHQIPKCASLYTGKFDYNYTLNGNAINISLANSARIFGIVVKISSLEPIQVVNIANIPSPECFVANSTFKEKIPFHLTKRYSTLFHCPTKDLSDFWSNSNVSWILITFSEKFKNCELISCPAILEFIELYETVNDECYKPDVPAFAKLIPVKHNGSFIRYKYQCNDHFLMEERRTSEVFCTSRNDWSLKNLPKCVPNMTCDVEQFDELIVTYNWLWSPSEAVVGTVAHFKCVDNSTKINGTAKRECGSDGHWTEELPQCIPIPTTVETTTTEYSTSTLNPNPYSEQSSQYPYESRPVPMTYPIQQNYPKPYPTESLQTHPVVPAMVMPTTVTSIAQLPQPNDERTANSLNINYFVYIFLGILMGILVTISVIYYIHKKKRKSLKSRSNRQLRSARNNPNDVFYDHHINHNINESQFPNTDLTGPVENNQIYPYDAAGYIQIEAVESMRMNSFRKYENYDKERAKPLPKPLPQVPK